MATAKQIRAAKLMSENILNPRKTQEEILLEAGYKKSIASTKPGHVTKSKGYQEILKKYLPAEYVIKKHKKILDMNEGDPRATQAVKLAYEVTGMLDTKDTNATPLQNLIQININ